jgi:hypothetical protein
MCMCVRVCVYVCAKEMDRYVSLSVYDLTTWTLAVRVYVFALDRPSLYKRANLYVCAPASPLSLSVFVCVCVCVCDWLGGGSHASLDSNDIGAEGAKYVGAGLAHCPNLTIV